MRSKQKTGGDGDRPKTPRSVSPRSAHLALWFHARKDACIVQQRIGAPGVLQHLERGPCDGEFEGARLQVRTVLRRERYASQKIEGVVMRPTTPHTAPHCQKQRTLSINSAVDRGTLDPSSHALISDHTTPPCLPSNSPSISLVSGATMPHWRAM